MEKITETRKKVGIHCFDCNSLLIRRSSTLQYHLGPWGGCSALCGEGIRQRKVTCFSKLANGTIEELNEEDCAEEKPDEEESCQSETPCEATDWLVTEWSGCSQDTCGESNRQKEKRDSFSNIKE